MAPDQDPVTIHHANRREKALFSHDGVVILNHPPVFASDEENSLARRLMQDSGDQLEAEAATRDLARTHYENFIVAGILLPRSMRQPFYNVYAFCRIADDAADESATPAEALVKLDRLRKGLRSTASGHPPNNLFLALAGTMRQFAIPERPFDDLLDAFTQDQTVRRYADRRSLLHYCERSANPVGRILLAMADVRDDVSLRQSDAICTALQLVNFWQDVKRDRAMGRIYIPLDALDAHAIDETDLDASTASAALRQVVLELCEWAESLFDDGEPLATRVPKWLGPSIDLFGAGGRQVIREIRRLDGDVLRVRPTVSKRSRLGMLARAFVRHRVGRFGS